jgi:hypothetical protein
MGPNRVNFIASREAHHVRLSSQASQDHAKFMCKDILVQTLAARLAEDGKEQSSPKHNLHNSHIPFLSSHFHYCLDHCSLLFFALSNELTLVVTIPRLQCDP